MDLGHRGTEHGMRLAQVTGSDRSPLKAICGGLAIMQPRKSIPNPSFDIHRVASAALDVVHDLASSKQQRRNYGSNAVSDLSESALADQ